MSKRKEMTLDEVLDECRRSWPGDEGERRAERVKALIEQVSAEYAAELDLSPEQVFETMEARRDYSAVNYYQRANFPALDDVTLYRDVEHFRETVGTAGFRCPRCKRVSTDPYECNSGADMEPGKVCDWKSSGLFGCLGGGHTLMLRDMAPSSVRPMTIFKPVALEQAGTS